MVSDLRIVIGDDHPVFRDGVKRALAEPGLAVVGEAVDGQTAYEMIRDLHPDVAVLDIGLPVVDGCAVARWVWEERLPTAIVFLTVCDDVEVFEQSLAWGVRGYLIKDATPAEIVRCVRAVGAGQHVVSPALTSHLVERTERVEHFTRELAALGRLSPQERVVLRRIALERQSKEIAVELGIAPRTVDAHRASICQKLGLHGNHVLRRFAVRHRDRI